ncbi:hypothetical protein K7X08_024852 [Anisodus acutangulus]|uniref:Transducin beta-like protein 3 n=1 Tax=Anisodus acutangulus TaxID=402998 RepID=A0A9Q1MBP1_9SOLA|nr:hypothetical protein K7X08_024852 [Anisodus acutangulus]
METSALIISKVTKGLSPALYFTLTRIGCWVWDLTRKKCLSTLEKHQSAIPSMAISEDGWTLLSAGRDKVVNLWNLRDYGCMTTIPIQRREVMYFITVGERGLVRIWSADRALCLFEQKSSDITISSDDEDSKRSFTSALILPANMKFLGDEEQFLAVSTSVEQVRVYDLTTMSCSYVLAGHTDVILCLDTCVSSSGRTLIVTGSKDNTVRLWDCQSKACVGVGIGHMGAVGAVVFSKKQRNLFVSGSSDRTLKVWNFDGLPDNNEEVPTLKAKAVVAAHDKDINSLAVAPDGSLVCSGSQDRTACIWRLPDLVSVVTLKGHKRGIWSVEFSPVDHCVMTTSGDETIQIWAISDGLCLKTFEGHTSSVLRASFLTRGTQLVSCGADGLMKLWTVKTNECVATYDQHEDKVLNFLCYAIYIHSLIKEPLHYLHPRRSNCSELMHRPVQLIWFLSSAIVDI